MLEGTGLFEFQHANGKNALESVCNGFQGWVDSDLPVFLDLGAEDPEQCTILRINAPNDEQASSFKRRVLVSPPAQIAQVRGEIEDDHPFCPCCLIMQNYSAFEELINEDAIYGVRLFAMSNENGETNADCRVNGMEYEKGVAALSEYAKSWPDRGYEFRKQYALMYTVSE